MSSAAFPGRLLEFASSQHGRALPPVHLWHPAYCGEIDMRIAADGRWFYQGTPILRLPLVKLFASILRCDGAQHVLVTPVERVRITVEDAPFLGVEMEPVETPDGESLAIRTNLDDVVIAGPAHPMRFAHDRHGGLKPYIRVRGDLWARFTRALAYDLASRIEMEGEGMVLRLGGMGFDIPAMPEAAS